MVNEVSLRVQSVLRSSIPSSVTVRSSSFSPFNSRLLDALRDAALRQTWIVDVTIVHSGSNSKIKLTESIK